MYCLNWSSFDLTCANWTSGRLEDEIKESNDKMDEIKDKIMATQTSAPPAQ